MPQRGAEETPLERLTTETLITAMERIHDAPESGMRFLGPGAEERYFTYKHIYAEAERRAAHLSNPAGLKLKKGDRLILMMAEAHEFVMSFLGCVLAGIVPTPVSPPMATKAGEHFLATAARIIDDSGAKAMLTTESSKPFAEQALRRASECARLITTEEAFAADPPPFDRP